MSVDLNKIPRWALILISMFGLGACGILVSTARADLDKFRSIAYQAKNNADDALLLGSDLKIQVADIRFAQEIFRKEYREDQKDAEKSRVEQTSLLYKIISKV